MTIFIIAWLALGFYNWLKVFIEFYNHPIVRPGLLVLLMALVAGPVPLIVRYFN